MAKNLCWKTVKIDDAYEIWKTFDWQWERRVLKKLQADDDKLFARRFCAVKSPMTYGEWELWDEYVENIKANAVLVSKRDLWLVEQKCKKIPTT